MRTRRAAGTERWLASSSVLLLVCGLAAAASGEQGEPIRVCADPDNLPYSNRELQGFEYKIGEVIAQELGASLDYYWWPAQMGMVRNTLQRDRCDVLISSTRLRAIESAEAVGPGRDFAREELLIEAPLPPPRWPSWIRLSPKIWGFMARFHWWFFNHHQGEENRREAEARADQAAAKLEAIADSGQNVVVLAHGFFNVLIGRALIKRGWRRTLREGYKYWSTRRFERL